MANGNGQWKLLTELLVRHGFSGLVAVGAFAVIIVFLLQPQATERKTLLDAITHSIDHHEEQATKLTESMESISRSTEEIAKSTAATDDSLLKVEFAVTQFGAALGEFTSEVREVHPRMEASLEIIEAAVTAPDGE